MTVANAVVTFASKQFVHTHRRFKKQSRAMEFFDHILIWSEKNLEPDFQKEFSFALTGNTRGYGYWVWKPQVILQALERLQTGDVLLYLDSGSHLVPGGRDRLIEYFQLAKRSESGILAFQLTLTEELWTKGDLLEHMEARGHLGLRKTPQVQAAAIVLEKRPEVVALMEAWLDIFRLNFDLVDDSPSTTPNATGFRGHRHDQSVFSLMAKIHNFSLLPAAEQYPHGGLTWKDLSDYPIHQRRDKKTIFEKSKRKLNKRSLPLQVFLVKAKAFTLRTFANPRIQHHGGDQ